MSRTANLTQLKETTDNVPSQRRGITLQRQLAQVPITSVAFFTTPSGTRYFLAGQDGELAIYPDAQPPPQAPLFTLPIFEDQPIHGIRVQGPRLLLWGASQIALLDGESLTEDHPPVLLATTTAPDWIYDAALSPFCVDDAVLATAHNEVVMLRYHHSSDNPGEQGTVVLGNVASPSRPMLYAAHLLWESASRVLIAAGTVFGDVLVWRYSIAEDEHAMAFVLRGHEGSIYGVDVSAPLVLWDGTRRRLLASCSDDRTIRIWDISLDGDEAAVVAAAAAAAASTHEGTQCVEAQDTGFKAAQTYDALQADSGEGEARPVAVGMGHASRIWGVRFALDSSAPECVLDGDALCVYSFGEDSTTQRWKLALDPREASTTDHLTGQLTHQHTYALHHGKHIWARALDVNAQGGVDILTGGADGKISAIREQALHDDGVQSFGPVFMALDVSDALGQGAGKGESFSSRETFSRYDFLSENQMLAITNAGRLFVGDLLARTWAEVVVGDDEGILQDLKRCYVLRTMHGHDGAAVIGTTNGKVYYFHRHQQHQVDDSDHDRDQSRQYRLVCAAEVPGRITEINHLASSDQQLISILVHIHGSSSSHLLSLTPSGEVIQRELLTGLDARFVAVSATRLDDLIILGSRHGYIALLTRHEDHTWQPILEAATRSRDAITAIVPLPTAMKKHQLTTTSPSCPYILTTSRDSKYRIYHIDHTPHPPLSTPSLTLIHETSPPFGPMIEGAWFTTSTSTSTSTPELILYGFRSKDFIIWNESTGEELATVNCGGAHRTFRLQHDSRAAPHRYRFAYTRTSKLCISSQTDVPYRTVRRGTHGREVRALSANKRFVASGAEDTSIRIWECMPAGEGTGEGTGEGAGEEAGEEAREEAREDRRGQVRAVTMRNMACIKAHVTGLQKLRWFGDEYLFSSAGNEEFFVWRVRRLGDGSAYAGLAVMCEGVFTEKSPVGDLRILDFDVSWAGGPEGQGRMVVTLAFSNSSLKTYEYECGGGTGTGTGTGSGSGSFRLLAEGRYTGACITQLRHLGFGDESSEEDVGDGSGNGTELHVLTASTDGHLALWGGAYLDGEAGTTQRYALEAAYAVHQSSIKSLDMSRDGIQIRVVTGGDDNALGYVQIAEMQSETGTERRTSYGFVSRAIIRKAHTAAVNGVALLPAVHHRRQLDQGPEETLAVSVSNDQRVKVWHISAHEARDVRVSLVACMSSGVADPGDVAIIRPDPGQASQIVLGGVGVEVWRIQHADAQRDMS
ncbi:hypothetical protein E4U35_004489 [Claviceps purpurea]|nr:hypothetical protein E4U35_004489 [Claviceps purpurea]